jgi:hypothetical protein
MKMARMNFKVHVDVERISYEADDALNPTVVFSTLLAKHFENGMVLILSSNEISP